MPRVTLHEGLAIRSLVPDLRESCFSFSPDFLAAIARRRHGRAGVLAVDASQVRCFIPVVLFKRGFLKLATLLAPPIGEAGDRLPQAVEGNAMEGLTAYLGKAGLAHRLTQPTNWSLFQRPPSGAVAAPFGSYVLPLEEGIDTLWQRLRHKHRSVIRKAGKAGVQVIEGPGQLDTCIDLHRETMRRNAMSHEPRSFLEGLMHSKDFNVFCAVAYIDGRPVGALFAPYNRHGAYYLLGGSAKDTGVNGANHFLHFEAIRRFVAQGAAFYDFVGARLGEVGNRRLHGIQRFKAGFGPDLHRGFLWKQDLSAAHCLAFDALRDLRNRALRRGRQQDIIDQERARFELHPVPTKA